MKIEKKHKSIEVLHTISRIEIKAVVKENSSSKRPSKWSLEKV